MFPAGRQTRRRAGPRPSPTSAPRTTRRARRRVRASKACCDSRMQRRRKRCLGDPAADLGARPGERRNVVDVEVAQPRRDSVGEPVVREKFAECARGRGESARHADRPRPPSWLIISPSEAFLPPTSSTSVIRRRSKETTRGLSLVIVRALPTEGARGQSPLVYRHAKRGPGRARPIKMAAARAAAVQTSRARVVRSAATLPAAAWRYRPDRIRPALRPPPPDRRRRRRVWRAALHRAAQRAVQVRMGLLEIADDLEVDPLHLRQVDLLDVHEPQQLACTGCGMSRPLS